MTSEAKSGMVCFLPSAWDFMSKGRNDAQEVSGSTTDAHEQVMGGGSFIKASHPLNLDGESSKKELSAQQ